MHGFPYDVHAYDEVAAELADDGRRVIVPYLRGFGPTRFLDPQTLRSGQQGALAADLLDLVTETLTYTTRLLPGFELPLARLLARADRWKKRKRTIKPPADPETTEPTP